MAEAYRTTVAPRMDTKANSRVDYPDLSLVSPMDRVRWTSILAGLFTMLATLTVLTVFGLALGLSTFDANQPQNFGIGAGIYGVISALVAFGLGGYMSARTTAVAGRGNAMLNGAMVWIVAIPLIVNLLGSGIGSLLGTATDVATTAASAAAQVAAPVVGEAAEVIATTPQAQATVASGAEAVATQAQSVVQDIQTQVENIDAQDVEQAARNVSGAAWAALLALGLTAAAATVGGYLGVRTHPTDVAVLDR
jgi:hypothetical protein